MSNNIVLETKNIQKKIGKRIIINDVSLKLYQGDILGFIGPNGAGKTTTIKLMLGLQSFDSGNVEIAGYNLKKDLASALSNVGAIVENPDLYMYMSGYENLEIAANLCGASKDKILEVIKIVGLENRIHDKVKKYSLGMRQRLGIAQAIIHNPQVLILDEPMNGLDPEGIRDLKVLLTKLATERKMAILVSSHLLGELETICNRICILFKGKIIQDLSIDEIMRISEKKQYTIEVSTINFSTDIFDFETIDNHHIKVNTTKNKLSDILRTLLVNGVDIYEIKKELTTLEDIYLNTTSGV